MRINNYLFIVGLINLAFFTSHCGIARKDTPFYQKNKGIDPTSEIDPEIDPDLDQSTLPSNLPAEEAPVEPKKAPENLKESTKSEPEASMPSSAKAPAVNPTISSTETFILAPVPAPKTKAGSPHRSPAPVTLHFSPVPPLDPPSPVPPLDPPPKEEFAQLESLDASCSEIGEESFSTRSEIEDESDNEDEDYVPLTEVFQCIEEDRTLQFEQALAEALRRKKAR